MIQLITVWPPQWLSRMHVLGPAPHGKGPIPTGLLEGDIILMAPVAPTRAQNVIFSAQQLAFPLEDSAFTHVGIYVGVIQGQPTVVDATPSHQIQARPFDQAVAGCYFRALRYTSIGAAKRWDICYEAAQLIGRYNFVAAIADGFIQGLPFPLHWKQALAKLTHPNGRIDTLYCGQLVDVVYGAAIGVSVIDQRTVVPLPAAFSASPRFQGVPLHW